MEKMILILSWVHLNRFLIDSISWKKLSSIGGISWSFVDVEDQMLAASIQLHRIENKEKKENATDGHLILFLGRSVLFTDDVQFMLGARMHWRISFLFYVPQIFSCVFSIAYGMRFDKKD